DPILGGPPCLVPPPDVERSALRIPQPYRTVRRRRGQPPAVGREAEGKDLVDVALRERVGIQRFTRGQLPALQRAVVADERLAIRCEDASFARPGQPPSLLAVHHVPDNHTPGGRQQQRAAVRRKGQPADVRREGREVLETDGSPRGDVQG